MLFQVRIHGRGGQGVVTAAELLSVAAFREGRQAQAFPSFGSERTGAPVVAFCRIADHEIRAHEPIANPDALIIQDPTLLHQVDLFSGLSEDGYLLINSSRGFSELGLGDLAARFRASRVVAVPATESTTRTPKEVMDAPPTGPVITPVEGFRVIPEGSDPMMENV